MPSQANGIGAVVNAQNVLRNGIARDAVETVATGDEIAGERLVDAVVLEVNDRRVRIDTLERVSFRLEQNLAAGREPHGDHVLDAFLLAVDRHPPAGERIHVDAAQFAVEARIDAVVDEALALHAGAEARRIDEIDRRLFEKTRAHAMLDIMAALRFEDDQFDAGEMQEVREQQSRRPRADDPDLRAHFFLRHSAVDAVLPRSTTLIVTITASALATIFENPLGLGAQRRVSAYERGASEDHTNSPTRLRVSLPVSICRSSRAIAGVQSGQPRTCSQVSNVLTRCFSTGFSLP